MTVTLNTPEWMDAQTCILSWSSGLTNPTFYVYQNGALVLSTTGTSYVFHIEEGDTLSVEVLDVAATEPQYGMPGRQTLCWYPISDAVSYRIDEQVASVWTERQTILDENQAFFRWRTRHLEDETTHEFRVVGIDTSGNDGSKVAWFRFLMVRHPDLPTVAYTYNGATPKTVTIAAA